MRPPRAPLCHIKALFPEESFCDRRMKCDDCGASRKAKDVQHIHWRRKANESGAHQGCD